MIFSVNAERYFINPIHIYNEKDQETGNTRKLPQSDKGRI